MVLFVLQDRENDPGELVDLVRIQGKFVDQVDTAGVNYYVIAFKEFYPFFETSGALDSCVDPRKTMIAHVADGFRAGGVSCDEPFPRVWNPVEQVGEAVNFAADHVSFIVNIQLSAIQVATNQY